MPGEDRDSGCSMDTSNADSGQGSTGSDDITAGEHHHHNNNQRLNNAPRVGHKDQLHHLRGGHHGHNSQGPHPHHHRQYSHDHLFPRSPVIKTQGLKPGYSSHSKPHRNSFHGSDAEKPALPPRENRKSNNISQMFARDVLYKDIQKASAVTNSNNVCRVHGLPSTKHSHCQPLPNNQSYNNINNSVNLHEISTEVHV